MHHYHRYHLKLIIILGIVLAIVNRCWISGLLMTTDSNFNELNLMVNLRFIIIIKISFNLYPSYLLLKEINNNLIFFIIWIGCYVDN